MPPVESSQVIPDSFASAVDRALETLDALAALGEDVEDEWQYIQDLDATWRQRLEAVAVARGGDALPLERGQAVARACDEAELIEDPHRAIDWLSTVPQVILAALGERP